MKPIAILAGTALLAFANAPPIAAQSIAIGSAPMGETSGTMDMSNGMSMRAATGGRSVTINMGGVVRNPPGGGDGGGDGGGNNGGNGGGGGGNGATPGSSPSPMSGRAAVRRAFGLSTVAVEGDSAYLQCVDALRRLPAAERRRMQRRCNRLR